MKYLTSIFALVISLFTQAQTGLDSLVKKPDSKVLFSFQKKVDRFFSDDWKFKSLTIEQIDHFINGYVLTWKRSKNGLSIQRSYFFYLDSNLAYTYEERFLNGKPFSRGFVHFKTDTIDYVNQALLQRHSSEYGVIGYTYEIYDNGEISCIYKTKNRNHYEMLFETRSEKIELVKGTDCLSIMK